MNRPSKIAAFCAASALCIGGTYALKADIKDGLVAHLTFDTNYTDASGHGVDGTPNGDPTLVTGLLGKAVSLTADSANGIFNYVALGTPELLNFGSDVDFSVSFWANFITQSSDPVFIATQDWNSSNNQGWGIYMQGGGNVRVVITDDRGSAGKVSNSGTPSIRDGTWHLVTVTVSRKGSLLIYEDGVQVASSSMAAVTGSIDNGIATNIGQDNTGVYDSPMTDVKMDDLGIWRRALSPGEVAAIYSAGKGGKNIEQVPTIQNPYLASTVPADKAAGVAPNADVSAVITDGLNRLAASSVKMTINGADAAVTLAKTGQNTTITHTGASGLYANGLNTVVLTYSNDAASAASFTNKFTFISQYAQLAAGTKVTPDTSKPGFVWNVFANVADVVNENDHTELTLAGLVKDGNGDPLPNLADPTAQGPASGVSTAPSPANAPISFSIPSVINLSKGAGDAFGSFAQDDQMPGIPATDGGTDGIKAEILTYIELPAGVTKMAVASDDGFRTSVGASPDIFGSVRAGEYNGGRGVGETAFYIVTAEAGVYGFRTTYENGGGDGNIEWYSFKADGTKVLINDVANGGLKAYRATSTKLAPYAKLVSPPAVPRQLPAVSKTLTVVLSEGDQTIDTSSVALTVDGKPVTVATSKQGKTVTVTYTPTTLLVPDEKHTGALTFKYNSGAGTYAQSWSFRNLKNVVLPTAKVTENFDSTAEGAVPAGWHAWNFTTSIDAGEDLGNLNSDSFLGWIVISRDALAGLKSRIFNVAPDQTLNGQPVTVDTLSTGNLLYAESDVRDGSQVQFITSKPFNLSSIKNAVLSFGSLYEQNQDSIGAVEYSVDGGVNWLPVVYFIDYADSGGDIVIKGDGTVDGVATLLNANGDTASWTDNGVAKGGKYGDGVAAPIVEGIGDYIAPRANDNSTVDKRLEVFRLPAAGGKSDVRLRFAQLGTGSWYFGVDNIAFYEDPNPTTVAQSKLSVSLAGSDLVISWTSTGTLQSAPSVTGPWTDAVSQTNPQTGPATGAAKFYRVRQ